MNFCSTCGTALTDEARFCSSCGGAVSEVLDQEDAEILDHEEALESVPKYKVFTKRYVAVLALLGLLVIGGGAAFALNGTEHTAEYKDCVQRFKPAQDAEAMTAKDVSEVCGGYDHPSEDVGSDTEGYSDSEGYSEQPKTCLEWKTNYNHISRPGGGWDRVPTGQTCVRTG